MSARLRTALNRMRTLLAGTALPLVLASLGCIAAPAIPGGPLHGTSLSVPVSWGYALAPANVQVQGERGASSFRDAAADAINMPFLPARFGARIGVIDFLDVAGDLGWRDGGWEVRAGLPEGSKLPFSLGFGMRRGSWALTRGAIDSWSGYPIGHEQRLRLELYPRLGTTASGARANGMGALGWSWGPRYHELFGPDQLLPPEPRPSDDASRDAPRFRLLRDEQRLEAALGAELRQDDGGVSFVLMPYLVTRAGAPRELACANCSDWRVTEYNGGWGISLFVTVFWNHTFYRLR